LEDAGPDLRAEWLDGKGVLHCERVFEDIVFSIFSYWMRVGEESFALGYRKKSRSPDGVLHGVGPRRGDVLYECKMSRSACDIRRHETQIREHIGDYLEVGRNIENYLLVSRQFTPGSIDRVQALSQDYAVHRVQFSLWEIEALYQLGLLYRPRKEDRFISEVPRDTIMMNLLKKAHVTTTTVSDELGRITRGRQEA